MHKHIPRNTVVSGNKHYDLAINLRLHDSIRNLIYMYIRIGDDLDLKRY